MFSQWKHTIENLAQHAPRLSQDGGSPPAPGSAADPSSPSTEPPLRHSLSSSGGLADVAVSTLRKSLSTQRAASPVLRSPQPDPSSPGASAAALAASRSRTTLEDRLRAKFAIGEASERTSPNPSMRSTPSSTPVPVVDHPLSPSPSAAEVVNQQQSAAPNGVVARPMSPRTVPLPDSPRPSIEAPQPISAVLANPLSAESESTEDAQATDINAEKLSEPAQPPAAEPSTEAVTAAAQEPDVAESEALQETTPTLAEEPQLAQPVVAVQSATPDVEEVSEPTVEHTEHSELPTLESGEMTDTSMAESFETAETSTISTAESVQDIPVDVEEEAEPVLVAPPLLATDAVDIGSRLDVPPEDLAAEGTPTDEVPPITDNLAPEEPQIDVITAQDPPAVDAHSEEPAEKGNAAVETEESATEVSGVQTTDEEPPISKAAEADIEGLRERLKLVEQRFTDVSTSFKRLQAEKAAADRILRELTPLESIQEVDALRDFLQNVNFKTEMAQDEIRRLTGKLTRQDERIEELRDTHRLESKSQSEQIHRLRGQLDEAEALLKATQNSAATFEAESAKRESEITRLQGEADKLRATAKDEEEKRVKAIGLLKTVRQKLVKTEKEREDAMNESRVLLAREAEVREKERAERQRLQGEIEKERADKEATVQGLRAQFEKEMTLLKDRQEKELLALRGQYELETITLKSAHSHELETRDTRIAQLDSTVKSLTTEKAELFDQLQMRQAELESSQSSLESLQSQFVESQYQMREANDRIALLTEELADARRDQVSRSQDRGPSTEEVTRLLSAAEAKYESRIADLRRQLTAVERERDDGEALFSKKLAEKAKEVDQLRGAVSASTKDHQEEKGVVNALREEIKVLKEQASAYQQVIDELRVEAGKVTEVQGAAQTQLAEANARIAALQQQAEEHKAREAQVRAHNKTLREELRKVQSSAALLERQRNPGVGYWATKPDGTPEARSPTSSTSDLAKNSSSRPTSPSLSDEEVNFEYLRNVILQFLEHKEMRPHLVRILSTILRFTPQETRRLISKV